MMHQPVHLQRTVIDRLRQRLIQIIALFSLVTAALLLVLNLSSGGLTLQPAASAALVVFALANMTVLLLIGRGAAAAATWLLVISLALMAAITRLGAVIDLEGYPETLVLISLFAAAILALNRNGFIAISLLALGSYTLGTLLAVALQPGITLAAILHDFLLIPAFGLVGVTAWYFTNQLERALRQVERNTNLLQASAEIGQLTSQLLDLDTLLDRALAVIQQQYGFYHAQVFLVNDTRDQAVLRASTGEIGQQLLARRHRLLVGSQSVIGQVTLRGEPVVVNNVQRAGGAHSVNDLLPETRSEMAVPLVDGSTIIGALDVQSRQVGAFQPEDIRALRVSANLLATAIRSTRLVEAQRATAAENARLLAETRAQQAEIARQAELRTSDQWGSYLSGQNPVSGLTLRDRETVYDSHWSPELLAAGRKRQPIITYRGDQQVVAVPVILRGAVIGAIEVELDEPISEADAGDMMTVIAQRLAISLDNARLFEESQEDAIQEQRINTIVSNFQAANSVDELLRITLTELSESLGAERGAIRLGSVKNEGNGHA